MTRSKFQPMLAAAKTTSEVQTAKFAVSESLARLAQIQEFLKPLSASPLPRPVEDALAMQQYMIKAKLTGAKKAIDRALAEVEPMIRGSDE